MRIDTDSCDVGNAAIASVLLLYYHLIREGGITHDQTVYIDPALFDPFKFIDVVVEGDGLDIDQALIREGAVIHLLCDLNDCVSDYEGDYFLQPFTERVVRVLEESVSNVKGVSEVVAMVKKPMESVSDFQSYQGLLSRIYFEYVVARFEGFIDGSAI